MLLDQDFRRRQQRDLMAVADHDDRRDQRNDRLAAADVAFEQPVHRLVGLQVGGDLSDHAFLRIRQPERQDALDLGAHLVVDGDPARLRLHLFAGAPDAQRELQREELLQDDADVGARAAAEKRVVELRRAVDLFERGGEIDHAEAFAERGRERIVERRERVQRAADDLPQGLRRDVADLRVDRNDGAVGFVVPFELFPIGALDLELAVGGKLRRPEDGQAVAAFDLIGEKALIEPDQLHRAGAVLQHRFEHLHPAQPGDVQVRIHDLSAQENRRVDMAPDVDDANRMAPVFVAIRKVVEEIAGGGESGFFELLRADGSGAGQRADGRVGGDRHACIVTQRPELSVESGTRSSPRANGCSNRTSPASRSARS